MARPNSVRRRDAITTDESAVDIGQHAQISPPLALVALERAILRDMDNLELSSMELFRLPELQAMGSVRFVASMPLAAPGNEATRLVSRRFLMAFLGRAQNIP
eukprot:2310007-Pleurochrysis_carterae.AAC.1